MNSEVQILITIDYSLHIHCFDKTTKYIYNLEIGNTNFISDEVSYRELYDIINNNNNKAKIKKINNKLCFLIYVYGKDYHFELTKELSNSKILNSIKWQIKKLSLVNSKHISFTYNTEEKITINLLNKKEQYPVYIYYVVKNYSDIDDRIKEIKTHAINSNALFITRLYNPKKYSEDCNFVERLPAFHVYIKKAYIKTFYPNTRPLQHIDESIELYLNKIENKKKRKNNIYKYIKKIFSKKTRMEKYEEEKVKINKNISEWN